MIEDTEAAVRQSSLIAAGVRGKRKDWKFVTGINHRKRKVCRNNSWKCIQHRVAHGGIKQVGPRRVYNTIRDGNDCSEKDRRFVPAKKQSVYNTKNANSYPSLHALRPGIVQSVQPHATDWWKVKVTLEQATKTQRGSKGIALLLL